MSVLAGTPFLLIDQCASCFPILSHYLHRTLPLILAHVGDVARHFCRNLLDSLETGIADLHQCFEGFEFRAT